MNFTVPLDFASVDFNTFPNFFEDMYAVLSLCLNCSGFSNYFVLKGKSLLLIIIIIIMRRSSLETDKQNFNQQFN